MKITKKRVAGLIIALLILIQFYPIKHSNPPVTSPFDGPQEVNRVFEASCMDCHSNKTHWPWYSYIAPVSWLVANDVYEGRKELNLSKWGEMTAKRRAKKRKEVWKEVREGDMPISYYLWVHPGARLSDAQKEVLRNWSQAPADSARTTIK